MALQSNVVILAQDDQGYFFRQGTYKYRPTGSTTGLRRGMTVRAWFLPITEPGRLQMNVQTPNGLQVWEREQQIQAA